MLARLRLIESRREAHPGRAVSSGAISTVVHAVLIVSAVFASGTAHVVREALRDTNLIFVTPPKPDMVPEQVEPPSAQEQLAVLVAPAQGFQTVVPPSEIPTEIPPVDLTELFDPRNYTGKGVEGGVAWGDPTSTTTVDVSEVFLEAVVHERPETLSCPVPRYPDVLREAEIAGRVTMRFIIAADGRAERESIEVVRTTHSGFIGSAMEVVRGCRFRPGRISGQPVRTVVQLPIRFEFVR